MSFSAEPKADQRVEQWTRITVAGVGYLRLPLRTRWLDATDDLVVSLKESLSLARPGDTVGVSEKVAILLTGRTVDIEHMQPGRLCPPAWRTCAWAFGPGEDGVRRPHRRLKADYSRGDWGCADSAVGHAWNLLSNRWADSPRCRRRAPHCVRACAFSTFGQQGCSAHLC